MIQRIQTVYLLLALAASVLLFILPVYSLLPAVGTPNAGDIYEFSLSGVNVIKEGASSFFTRYPALLLINGVISLLIVATIFQFKKRKRQIQFIRFILLCSTGLIVLILFYTDQLRTIASAPDFSINWPVSLLLLLPVFLYLASRAVKKDEELVRSADRLR